MKHESSYNLNFGYLTYLSRYGKLVNADRNPNMQDPSILHTMTAHGGLHHY